jgi:catechol 2,3-dioxygenase-like lactoylglutathione lyase family enzyme
MINPHLTFHHFGLAVRRPDEARKFVTALGYQSGESVFDPAQNVYLQLWTHARHPAVEIIWPGDTAGPVDKLVQRHASGITYHLCYETDNLAAALAGLTVAGLRPICISPATPAPLFSGRPVSFYNVVGMGLIEILEQGCGGQK